MVEAGEPGRFAREPVWDGVSGTQPARHSAASTRGSSTAEWARRSSASDLDGRPVKVFVEAVEQVKAAGLAAVTDSKSSAEGLPSTAGRSLRANASPNIQRLNASNISRRKTVLQVERIVWRRRCSRCDRPGRVNGRGRRLSLFSRSQSPAPPCLARR
jgi:hypothetical protein